MCWHLSLSISARRGLFYYITKHRWLTSCIYFSSLLHLSQVLKLFCVVPVNSFPHFRQTLTTGFNSSMPQDSRNRFISASCRLLAVLGFLIFPLIIYLPLHLAYKKYTTDALFSRALHPNMTHANWYSCSRPRRWNVGLWGFDIYLLPILPLLIYVLLSFSLPGCPFFPSAFNTF